METGTLASTTTAEPAVASRTKPALGDATGDWFCAWCLNRVANDKDRFKFDGQDEFVFTNPEGIRFEIITFLQVPGCHDAGLPTFEHTWFPDHAWSFCLCDRCGQHLGWFYTGPNDFAGLIIRRLVRSSIRN